MGDEVNGEVNGLTNGHHVEEESEPMETDTEITQKPTKRRKVKLSYDKYRSIANMLVLYMRQEEDKPTTTEGRTKNIDPCFLEIDL